MKSSAIKSLIKTLPKSAGIYQFFSAEGDAVPLYVGKSVNIHARVLSHYTQANSDAKERRLMSQVNHIAFEKTAGELGALLLEASLIKKLQPVFNRRLRRSSGLYVFGLEKREGIYKPKLTALKATGFQVDRETFGLYRSQHQAKKSLLALTKSHGLCLKKMGIESGSGACFDFYLKKCNGICVGHEAQVAYNSRVLTAIAELKNHTWPYPGPIAIEEGEAGYKQFHIINQWYYLGCFDDMSAIVFEGSKDDLYYFDIDHYKILIKYVLHKQSMQLASRNQKIKIHQLG